METSQERKRGSGWSQTDLQNALDEINHNQKSERAAALKHNLPRRTLKNHIKSGSVVKRVGRKAGFTEIWVKTGSEISQEKKRGSGWSQADLQDALDEIKNKKMSERAAALKYNIPRRTLKNHIKSGSVVKRSGRKAVFTDTQEKELVEKIKIFSNVGSPLTPKIIREQAYLFCERNNIKNPFSEKKSIAGRKWLHNFLARNKDLSQSKD